MSAFVQSFSMLNSAHSTLSFFFPFGLFLTNQWWSVYVWRCVLFLFIRFVRLPPAWKTTKIKVWNYDSNNKSTWHHRFQLCLRAVVEALSENWRREVKTPHTVKHMKRFVARSGCGQFEKWQHLPSTQEQMEAWPSAGKVRDRSRRESQRGGMETEGENVWAERQGGREGVKEWAVGGGFW